MPSCASGTCGVVTPTTIVQARLVAACGASSSQPCWNSIPHASIGFLALIIGPALLVGLAPSVLVTYGRLKVHAATSTGDSLIVALVLLAVLVGVALWIGRPLSRNGGRPLLASPLYPCGSALRGVARAPARAGGTGVRSSHHSSPVRAQTPGRHRPGRTAARRRGGSRWPCSSKSRSACNSSMSRTSACGPWPRRHLAMRRWSSASPRPSRACIGSGASARSGARFSIGCQPRRTPTRQSLESRICRTCTSSASATAIAWRPGRTARAATGAFVAPGASSPRSTR